MIKVMIIEDEPASRKTLALMLKRVASDIAIIDNCASPIDGIVSIQKNKPDLIFLDIHMPQMNGFEMLKQIPLIDFEVIFTTAYDQYAIEAIRVCALDYLLKPIGGEDLETAVNRFRERALQHSLKSATEPALQNPSNNIGSLSLPDSTKKLENLLKNISNRNPLEKTITVSSIEGIRFVKMNDILRLEACGRYTQLHLISGQKVTVSKTLGEFETMLAINQFFRIHESHIINLNYLEKYHKSNNTVILADKSELGLARRRKDEFLKLVNRPQDFPSG